MGPHAGEKLEVDESQKVLEIDKQYAAFKVLRKPEELEDKNFPPHLHAAAQLFMMAGMIPQVKQLKKDVDCFMETLKNGPDGKSSFGMGTACVCWQCGHVGLPANAEEVGEKLKVSGVCKNCNSDDQTNFVQLTQADGKVVPWLEPKKSVSIPEDAKPEPLLTASKAGTSAPTGAHSSGTKKIPPNAPCPCGSSIKFKKCCGKGL